MLNLNMFVIHLYIYICFFNVSTTIIYILCIFEKNKSRCNHEQLGGGFNELLCFSSILGNDPI